LSRPVFAPETLDDARAALSGAHAWIVTDGKAGDLAHCRGIAERLGLSVESRIVAPRAPFVWAMPHLWRLPWIGIDPRERPGRLKGALAAPLPDLVIASGRRAAAYLPAIKRASGGKVFTVFLKDPRTSPKIADFIWVPHHDRLRGENVLTTLLSPHRFSPELLQQSRLLPPEWLARLAHPRVAILLGGDTKEMRFTPEDRVKLATAITTLAASGAGLMATASRRTPPDLALEIREIVAAAGGYFWNESGENPYPAFLANADAFVVTADSVNMVGEAVASGKPVHVFRPAAGSQKIDAFLRILEGEGAVRAFSGRVENDTYPPLDDTPAIAIALARHYLSFRQKLRSQT